MKTAVIDGKVVSVNGKIFSFIETSFDDWLCLEALEDNSTIQIVVNSTGSNNPYLQFSTDGNNWETFVVGTTEVALEKTGDAVYFRGKNARLNTGIKDYIKFVMTGKISASGDVGSILSYEGSPAELPAFTFYRLFYDCKSLMTLPKLPSTILRSSCYQEMFSGCTGIKLSATETDEYSIPYRIPSSGDGVAESDSLTGMFANTGGTFTGKPEINTVYYLAEP